MYICIYVYVNIYKYINMHVNENIDARREWYSADANTYQPAYTLPTPLNPLVGFSVYQPTYNNDDDIKFN
jgi:hypothetical protein